MNDPQWISCADALQALDPTTLMQNNRFEGLRKRCALGKLKARAEVLLVVPHTGREYRMDDETLPAWVFADHQGLTSKLVVWSGQYIRLDQRGPGLSIRRLCDPEGRAIVKIEVVGLHFCREQIAALVPKPVGTEAVVRAVASSSKGGRPRDSDKWDAVTVAIARLANEGRLDPGMDASFRSQADLRRAILDDPDVAALDVSEDTLKPLAKKVFVALLPGR